MSWPQTRRSPAATGLRDRTHNTSAENITTIGLSASLFACRRAALVLLEREAKVLLIAAGKLGDGDALDDAEIDRMRISALRVSDAIDALTRRSST